MLNQKKLEDLAYVKKKIGEYMPLLIAFLDNDKDMLTYSKDLYKHSAKSIHLERQKDCVTFIREKLRSVFSDKEIEEMELDFSNGIISNIVDHHNILNHPILVSGLIISCLSRLLDDKAKSIFVLTCGGVPFSNLFHKRGFTFKNKVFPFVTGKDTDKILHGFPKKELDFLPLAESRGMLNDYTSKEREFLKYYQGVLKNIDISRCNNFIDEITRVNYSIFNLMFDEKIREKIPRLVDFETEYLASKMLGKLLEHKENFIHKALFNKGFREKVLKEFNGIWGAWNFEKNLGTNFFWLMTPDGDQAQLVCDGDRLVSRKEKIGFSVKLEEKSIMELVEKQILVPNIFLFYGILIFYCGVKPLTGLGSMNYLTDLQNAWIRVLSDVDRDEAELIKEMNMRSLICAPVVTYGRNENGEIVSEFFADMIFKGGLTESYLKNLSRMKFGDIMRTSLIDNYEIKVPQAEKIPLDLTANDLVTDSFSWIK
jgi:hypothetical protein